MTGLTVRLEQGNDDIGDVVCSMCCIEVPLAYAVGLAVGIRIRSDRE